MPQPAAQTSGTAVKRAAQAEVVAPAAVGAAGAGAAVAGTVALGAGAATIMTGLIAFLGALRQRQQAWLLEQLGRYSSNVDDIATVVAEEARRGEAFARNSADRVASAIPQALRIADPAEREKRVRQIMADEERYARQRSEAMAARAIAAVTRLSLKRDSPLGAYWEIGLAQQHTTGCRFMHGKFWPWAVLDRVHPPRHYGCTSRLLSFGEAVHRGLMSAGDVPDTRTAIAAAAHVMMEGEAQALEAELELREYLIESGAADPVALAIVPFAGLSEEFNPGELRDFHGRWSRSKFMPAAAAAAALKRGEPAAIKPADAAKLVDELDDGSVSSLHMLQVGDHANLFRVNARDLPRAQMPQIPKEHLPGFMDFLRSKRIVATVERVAPSRLRATQNQVNGGAAAKISKGWDPSRGGMMMVSKDWDVLDGHHRWAAGALYELSHSGYQIDALRFSASTDRMLQLMHEYNRQAGVAKRAFGEGPVAKAGAA